MMSAGPRRWLGLLAVLCLGGLGLAGLAVPAAGQGSTTTVTIDRLSPRCANLNKPVNVSVSGRSNNASVDIQQYSPSRTLVARQTALVSGGGYSATGAGPSTSQGALYLNPTETGEYEIRVVAGGVQASAFIEVNCQAPSLEFSPTCFTPGVQTTVRMIARHYDRFEQLASVVYDIRGSETQSKSNLTADNRGVFFADFLVTPSDRPHPGESRGFNFSNIANATWSACPPGVPPTTTSTSTTTTSTPGTTQPSTTSPDTVPDAVPNEEPATTTSLRITGTTTTIRPSDPPGPPVTLPPTLDLPPVTVGATLTVTPEVGPAGFVTGVTGTGFPPGPVELRWEPGIGRTIAIVGPDGTFVTRVLVFPNDRLGARALVATGGTTTALDAFLVVQSSVQPSGSDVQQINRIRRFNSR